MAGDDDNKDVQYWDYDPSKGAAILFLILWLPTTAYHIYQMFHYRKWYIWALIMGSLWEIGGFVFRIISINNQHSLGPYVAQQALAILAPLWIAAFDYMTLGRLIFAFIPDGKVLKLRARWVTLIFVLFDVGSFLVQLGGVSFISGDNPSKKNIDLGKTLLIIGLIVQLIAFGFFTVSAYMFQRKAMQMGGCQKEQWGGIMIALYVSCFCILLRSIYRMAEFAMDFPGPLSEHEAYVYVLDFLPMVFTAYPFNWWHPGKVFVGDQGSFRRAKKAAKSQNSSSVQIPLNDV